MTIGIHIIRRLTPNNNKGPKIAWRNLNLLSIAQKIALQSWTRTSIEKLNSHYQLFSGRKIHLTSMMYVELCLSHAFTPILTVCTYRYVLGMPHSILQTNFRWSWHFRDVSSNSVSSNWMLSLSRRLEHIFLDIQQT